MTRLAPSLFPVLIASLTACAQDAPSDASLRADVVAAMHASIGDDLERLSLAARALQAAAPEHAWSEVPDAGAFAAMRAAWRQTRIAYEHVEGATAPLFADFDLSMDARYDALLAPLGGAGDPDPFDGDGVTGMHAIERILYAPQIRDEVIAFEATLPGYTAAKFPATDAEAHAFKTGLVQRLIDDADALHAQWQPAAIDVGAAYQGLVGLMTEQREKVNLAATGEEESRYANVTQFDLRNNLAGTRQIYALFRTWIAARDGAELDAAIQARLDALEVLYGGAADALPPVPTTWSSDAPSTADLATPFGVLWQRVHAEVDPARPGSIVASMNEVALLLGFPEFIADRGAP